MAMSRKPRISGIFGALSEEARRDASFVECRQTFTTGCQRSLRVRVTLVPAVGEFGHSDRGASMSVMRLEGRSGSSNLEDRRGQRMSGSAGIGCGGVLLVLLISYFTGADPGALLQLLGGVQEVTQQEAPPPSVGAPQDQVGVFAGRVLKDTEDTWNEIFRQSGNTYEEPPMVLFTDGVRSGCGIANAGMGPFYCPADRKVYLDPSFFSLLSRRFGAPGDFAQAYVIAHEVGHHVQNVLGTSDRVTRAQQRSGEREANALSIRLELQADCYAGVWGHHANRKQIIEPGDFEEGMRAAASIGDDNIQRMSEGSVRPESWTHGSGEQRQFWLRRGLTTGDPNQCDTFKE